MSAVALETSNDTTSSHDNKFMNNITNDLITLVNTGKPMTMQSGCKKNVNNKEQYQLVYLRTLKKH